MSTGKDNVLFRTPDLEDGLAVHRLVSESPPLDLNSIYSYCLFGTHFKDTSIVAEQAGKLIGFISAYRIPQRADTLFVWQVVVAKAMRGQNIAGRMLDALLSRFGTDEVCYVEATVNPGNIASRGLFKQLARNRGTALRENSFLDASAFGSGSEHEPEILLRIPLSP